MLQISPRPAVVRGFSNHCQFRCGPALARLLLVAGLLLVALVSSTREAHAIGFPKTTAGAPFGPVVARPTFQQTSCATTAPLCVHAGATVSAATLVATRELATATWLDLEVLKLPRPLAEGDGKVHLYLADVPGEDGLRVGRGRLDLLLDRDAAPAFVVLDAGRATAGGCGLRARIAEGLTLASAYAVDVGEAPFVLRGLARHTARLVAPCPGESEARLARWQTQPWQALDADGVEYLVRFLDERRGKGFGAIVPALLSMAIEHRGIVEPTPDDDLGPAHFHDETSVFDVLAATMKDSGGSLDELLLDVAVARALEPVGPVLEWDVLASSLPRRLAVRRPVDPTGTTYVRVKLDAMPKGGGLDFDLEWEQGARFVWRVVKLDTAGKVVGEVRPPVLETARKFTLDVRALTGVASIVLVGVQSGDPHKPWRPAEPLGYGHAYEVGIFAAE